MKVLFRWLIAVAVAMLLTGVFLTQTIANPIDFVGWCLEVFGDYIPQGVFPDQHPMTQMLYALYAGILLVGALPAAMIGVGSYVFLSRKERRGLGETKCRACGYLLRGLSEPRCPECGEKI